MNNRVQCITLFLALLCLMACSGPAAVLAPTLPEANKPVPVKVRTLEQLVTFYEAVSEDKIDLVEASLSIAELEYGPVDRAAVYAWLDSAREKVKKAVANAEDSDAALLAFKKLIYGELSLSRVKNINDVEHTFLHKIVADKTGQCVGMSTVFIVLGEAGGLDFRPINAPKHLFIRYYADGKSQNVETLDRGARYSDRAVLRRARALFRQEPSKSHFREVSRKEMVAMMFNALAVVQATHGKLDASGETMRAAIRIAPDLELPYANLAILHRVKGLYDEALKLNRLALEKAENLDGPHLEQAMVYLLKSDFDKALEEVEIFAERSVALPNAKQLVATLSSVREQAGGGVSETKESRTAVRAFLDEVPKAIARAQKTQVNRFLMRERGYLGEAPLDDREGLVARLEGLCPNEQDQHLDMLAKVLIQKKGIVIPYRFSYVFVRKEKSIVLRKRSPDERRQLMEPLAFSDVNGLRKRLRDLVANIPADRVEGAVRDLTTRGDAKLQFGPFLFERKEDLIYVGFVPTNVSRPFIDAEAAAEIIISNVSALRFQIEPKVLPANLLEPIRSSLVGKGRKKAGILQADSSDRWFQYTVEPTIQVTLLNDAQQIAALKRQVGEVTSDVANFLHQWVKSPTLTTIELGRSDADYRFRSEMAADFWLASRASLVIDAEMRFDVKEKHIHLSESVTHRIPLPAMLQVNLDAQGIPSAKIRPFWVDSEDKPEQRMFGIASYRIAIELIEATKANTVRGSAELGEDLPTALREELVKQQGRLHKQLVGLLAYRWMTAYAKEHSLAVDTKVLKDRLAKEFSVDGVLLKQVGTLSTHTLWTRYQTDPTRLFAPEETGDTGE